MKIERHDGIDALEIEKELRLIYREAFAEAPYNKTRRDEEDNFRRFRSQVKRPGFRAFLARDDDSQPIGLAYGYPLTPSTGWWDTLTEPVSEELRWEDGQRTFGLLELAVRPAWRRKHVASAVHRHLVDGLPNQRVLLNTRPAAKAAGSAYRAWGYRKIGENHPWGGAALHDVMLLDLSPAASA